MRRSGHRSGRKMKPVRKTVLALRAKDPFIPGKA